MSTSQTAHARPSRPDFVQRLRSADPDALMATSVSTLMLNVTLRCDLACAHCHQSCSPTRTEEMSRDTMLDALELASALRPELLDITGGEPVLWPHLDEFVLLARRDGHAVRVRTNLTALTLPQSAGTAEMFAREGVAVLASLPGFSPETVSEQRGSASFERSLAALRDLVALGYGSGRGLTLDIAYNPPLGEHTIPEPSATDEFRAALAARGVTFDSLRVITNVPVGRYNERLRATDGLESYIDWLADAFNPNVAAAIECRCGLSVGWDGTLSDCDFNLGAGMGLAGPVRTLGDIVAAAREDRFALETLATRRIAFASHCFACTAGAGSG